MIEFKIRAFSTFGDKNLPNYKKYLFMSYITVVDDVTLFYLFQQIQSKFISHE